MTFYSTAQNSPVVGLEEAIFRGLPPDNGLYFPTEIRQMPVGYFKAAVEPTMPEIAFHISRNLFEKDEIGDADLLRLVENAFNFEAKISQTGPNEHFLELWHGPSMAFKDFGARFMAGLMSHFLSRRNREIHILVATSGDTGGAVAQGFFDTPGISVTILYPSGRVSPIQEKQLTSLGKNISAIEISGTFDDCQRLVKQAFLDPDLRSKLTLASANSINIARLIPQSFYYVQAYFFLKNQLAEPPVFSVPSGNFGNLSAGLWAWRMGLPVKKFIAATNENDAVFDWLETGHFEPKPTVATLSNAMDVGNPSNFPRLQLFSENNASGILTGSRFTDLETATAIRTMADKTGYLMCPHTAVAWLGWLDFQKKTGDKSTGIVLSTAHPAKFLESMQGILGREIAVPERLSELLDRPKVAVKMAADFEEFKRFLLN